MTLDSKCNVWNHAYMGKRKKINFVKTSNVIGTGLDDMNEDEKIKCFFIPWIQNNRALKVLLFVTPQLLYTLIISHILSIACRDLSSSNNLLV